MRNRIWLLCFLLSYPLLTFAVGFEDGGTIEEVLLSKNLIKVNGRTYKLPNSVKESSSPDGAPAIYQLKIGSYVFFSGMSDHSNLIDSLSIHMQPFQRADKDTSTNE